jgi:hypothetical protein
MQASTSAKNSRISQSAAMSLPGKAGKLSIEQIRALPDAPEGFQFMTNTNDRNWKSWCGREGVLMTKPKATNAMTGEELAMKGVFGLYAPHKPMDAAHAKMFATMAALPKD